MITPPTAQLEASIRWWVAMGSGLTPQYVMPGNSGRPAPNESYATVLLISTSQRGRPVHVLRRDDDGIDLVERTEAIINARYSLQWYRGEAAADHASRFRTWAYSTQGRHSCATGRSVLPNVSEYHGIGGEFVPFVMMNLTDPARLDAIISGDEEPRYTATLDIQHVQVLEAALQRIAETDILISDGISPSVTIPVQ